MLRAGITLIIFGVAVIVLVKFNVAADSLNPLLDPTAFAGGSLVLVVLTLIGVPVIPAAVAGAAVWGLMHSFLT